MDHSSPADCGFSSESSFHNEAAEAYDRTYSPGPPYSLSHFAQQRLSPSSSQKDVPSPSTSNENPNQALIIQPAAPTRQNVPSNVGFLSQTSKVPAKLEDGPPYITASSCLGYACSRSYACICLLVLIGVMQGYIDLTEIN